MNHIGVLKLAVVLVVVMVCGARAGADLKFSGYTQARYNFWDRDLPDSDDAFDLRRAYIAADGRLDPQTTFRFQIDLAKLDETGSGSVELKDAWVKRTLNEQWTAQLGFFSQPFGLEVPQSNAALLPLERSQAGEKLFPGQRATGLYFTYKPTAGRWPTVVAGFSNGMAKWYSADKQGNVDTSTEMLLGRAQWDLGGRGVVGASYRHAQRTRTVSGVDQEFNNHLWGLHGRYAATPRCALQAEYYGGEELSADVDGWYGQVEYALPALPVTVYGRHDRYDFGGSADFRRHTLGAAWAVSKAERVTLQGERYEDGKGGKYTDVAVQYQYQY